MNRLKYIFLKNKNTDRFSDDEVVYSAIKVVEFLKEINFRVR